MVADLHSVVCVCINIRIIGTIRVVFDIVLHPSSMGYFSRFSRFSSTLFPSVSEGSSSRDGYFISDDISSVLRLVFGEYDPFFPSTLL